MSKILRLEDGAGDHGTMLEVYSVPEGACLTVGAADENVDGNEYLSVILRPNDALQLAAWLAARYAGEPSR